MHEPPLLSLAMIVKNEEAFLAEALESARPYVDEMVVVDTGSTDATVEIARQLGARVEHFAWQNDFAAARNFSLRACRGRFILVLDADERLRGPAPAALRSHLHPGPDHPFQGWAIKVLNVTRDGTAISSFLSVRVFPNDPHVGYVGRVHNRLGALDAPGRVLDAAVFADFEIVHFGYDKALYRERQKAERSLPLIEALVAERPDDPIPRFYRGRELLDLGRIEEAQRALEEALEMALTKAGEGRDLGQTAETAVHLLMAVERSGERREAALELAARTLELVPRHADLWFRTALALRVVDRKDEAVHCFGEALACVGAETEAPSVVAHRLWLLYEHLGHTLWEMERYAEAYAVFLRLLDATPPKPESSEGWPALLTCLCAMALESGDEARLPQLRERLLTRDDTAYGMFVFEVDRRARRGGPRGKEAAAQLLVESARRHPRLAKDAEVLATARGLGIELPGAPGTLGRTLPHHGPAHPLRILVGTANVAGYVEHLAGGLRALGHHVETVLGTDNPLFPDFKPDHRLADLLARSRIDADRTTGEFVASLAPAFLEFLYGFDLYVFVAAHSLLPGGADLPLLHARGKTIVSWLCGREVRHHTAALPMWAALGSPLPESVRGGAVPETRTDTAGVVSRGVYHNTLANRLHHLRVHERYATALFGTPEVLGLGLRPYLALPTPLDLTAHSYRVPGHGAPIVVHAPSHRGFHQTPRIVAALDALRADAVEFELRLLDGLPNAVIRRNLTEADVVVDQMSLYPGPLAHQAMASGCAVLTGNVPAALPVPWEKPCVHLEPGNLEATLRQVLTDRPLRLRLAAAGRAYVEAHADRVPVAARVLADVERARRGDLDLYPTFAATHFVRPAGEAITPRSQRLALEIVTAHGLPPEADVGRLVAQGLLPAQASSADVPRWAAPTRDVGPWIRVGPGVALPKA